MNLPPFVYALRFWEAVSFIAAGVLGLLAFFAVIPVAWAVGAGVILTAILAVLKFFGVTPELQLRAFMRGLK